VSEGEHTIISRIPRERLNQIAGRKLSALSLAVRLGADRETLEGELPFERLAHPGTGQPIARARFAVEGHDRLRFTEGPLAALPPVLFYDAERIAVVEQRVTEALRRHAAQIHEQASWLRGLGLEATADPERLSTRAVVKTPTHAFELVGSGAGIRVARVAPVSGKPYAVPPTFERIDPSAHASRIDLEVWLAGHVPEMEAAARSATAAPAAPAQASRLEATAPPRNAVTLGQLARAFGAAGVLAPSAPVEVFQEYQYAGTRYRFVAARDAGTLFKGRIIGPTGDVWSDRFEVDDFPGTAQVVAAALGAVPARDPEREEPARAATAPVLSHLQPRSGEVWVMNVVVEEAGPDEVRYVGTDIDGHPYGAARVLRRRDFEAVFARQAGGWRLLVVIDQALGDAVLYRQLDAQRQPVGAPRRMGTGVLVANFVPEAAAY